LHPVSTKNKPLFVDMGSNLGQGFQFFSNYYNPNIFDYWFVEANPFCIGQLRNNISKLYHDRSWKGDWKILNMAISNKDGILNLYGLVEDNRGKTSEGASVIKDHNSTLYRANEDKALKVQSVKASKLINDASEQYSTIVVKMDIESSEYDAIEELMGTGCINKIVHLYVEWHSQYFSADKISDVLTRERKLKAFLGVNLTEWH
jgi:FkbM family methyltransferase